MPQAVKRELPSIGALNGGFPGRSHGRYPVSTSPTFVRFPAGLDDTTLSRSERVVKKKSKASKLKLKNKKKSFDEESGKKKRKKSSRTKRKREKKTKSGKRKTRKRSKSKKSKKHRKSSKASRLKGLARRSRKITTFFTPETRKSAVDRDPHVLETDWPTIDACVIAQLILSIIFLFNAILTAAIGMNGSFSCLMFSVMLFVCALPSFFCVAKGHVETAIVTFSILQLVCALFGYAMVTRFFLFTKADTAFAAHATLWLVVVWQSFSTIMVNWTPYRDVNIKMLQRIFDNMAEVEFAPAPAIPSRIMQSSLSTVMDERGRLQTTVDMSETSVNGPAPKTMQNRVNMQQKVQNMAIAVEKDSKNNFHLSEESSVEPSDQLKTPEDTTPKPKTCTPPIASTSIPASAFAGPNRVVFTQPLQPTSSYLYTPARTPSDAGAFNAFLAGCTPAGPSNHELKKPHQKPMESVYFDPKLQAQLGYQ